MYTIDLKFLSNVGFIKCEYLCPFPCGKLNILIGVKQYGDPVKNQAAVIYQLIQVSTWGSYSDCLAADPGLFRDKLYGYLPAG
jgi:hypothetical protein